MEIVNLTDHSAASRKLLGGKGYQLANMLSVGMPVPGGYVVTTEAYNRFISSIDLPDNWLNLEPWRSDSDWLKIQEVRETILNSPMPADMREEIESLAKSMESESGDQIRWAVRSSGVAEDSSNASFAGQYETILGVKTEDLSAAVRECWSSAFTERATQYRLESGVVEQQVAVVVQQMVAADAAGVCFSEDPITGSDDAFVVNVSFGIGESVVSGAVTPDTYYVNRKNRVVTSKTLGDKNSEYVMLDGVAREQPITDERLLQWSIDDSMAVEIAGLTEKAEKMLEEPADIEFAVKDGKLFALQARPITQSGSSSAVPAEWTPELNTVIDPKYPLYSNGNISEVIPGCITPLSWSHTGELIAAAFDDQLRVFGYNPPNRPHALGLFYHRPYMNVSLLLAAVSRMPGVSPDTVYEEFVGKPDKPTPRFSKGDFNPARAVSMARTLGTLANKARTLSSDIQRCKDEELAEREHFTISALQKADAEWLIKQVEMSEDVSRPSVTHVWASTLATVGFQRLRETTAKWLDDESGSIAAGLVVGVEGLPSGQPMIRMHELSQEIAAKPAVKALFEESISDRELDAKIKQSELAGELARFIEDFGHRGVSEAELRKPSWREDSSQVVALLRNYLREGAAAPEVIIERQQGALMEARSEIEKLSGFKKRRLQSLAENARKDDVFFLLDKELFQLLRNELPLTEVAGIVAQRRQDFRYCERIQVPKIQEGEAVFEVDEAASSDTKLQGLGVSPGIAEGIARVVTDPRVDGYLEPGEVLVARVTDVAWTPLFAQASGAVVEVGGLLSHGSIVAREYGLPAVVGVTGAMKAIKTGDRVRVDGSTNTVTVLETAAGS